MSPRLRVTNGTFVVAVSFVVALVVYAASARSQVSLWDTGDLQTVPYILGIPYPTGFPGYVLLGWLWSHALPFGSVAWRLNLLCAIASAGTAGALALALDALGVLPAIALAAAAVYAFAPLPWEHATYVDVHPISWSLDALAVALAFRWRRDGRSADGTGLALAAAAAVALDNSSVLVLPGLALLVLARRPAWRQTWPLALAGLALIAAVYAYLPLRSAAVTAARLDPTLRLGIPPGRPFWDDHHPAELDGFVRLVGGTEFHPHQAFAAMLSPATLGRLHDEALPALGLAFGPLLPWAALLGAVLLAWREPLGLAGMVVLALVPLGFGFGYAVEADVARYEFPVYFVVAVLAGYGAESLFDPLFRSTRVAAAAVGAVALAALLWADGGASSGLFDRSGDTIAPDWIARVRRTTPPDAVLVVPWVYATPLGYAAFVEHSLGDRIVVTADPQAFAAHYRAWLRRRPVYIATDERLVLPAFHPRSLPGDTPLLYALR